MSKDFDPYYKWLGIPPKDQPPNHYRLLGIECFEEDREVINSASKRVMAYLKNLASGGDKEPAQKLFNEVAAARKCLLNADRKLEYDSKLTPKGVCPPPVACSHSDDLAQPPKIVEKRDYVVEKAICDKNRKRRERELHRIFWGSVLGFGTLVLITGFVIFWPFGDRSETAGRLHSATDAKPEPIKKNLVAKEERGERNTSLSEIARERPTAPANFPSRFPEVGDGPQSPQGIASKTDDLAETRAPVEKRPPKSLREPHIRAEDGENTRMPGHSATKEDLRGPMRERSVRDTQQDRSEDRAILKTGLVAEFHKNSQGDTDGLRLEDGTDVRFPARAHDTLAGVVSRNDRITIDGWQCSGESEIHAATIKNDASGKAVVVDRPPPEISGQHEEGRQKAEAEADDGPRPKGPPESDGSGQRPKPKPKNPDR